MKLTPTNAPATRAGHPFVIVQPNMAGHRFNYCRMLVESTDQNSENCLLVTSSAGAREFRKKAPAASLRTEVLVHDAPTSLGSLASYSALIEDTGVIVLPDGDGLVPQLIKNFGWRHPGHLRLVGRVARSAAALGAPEPVILCELG